VWWCGGGWCASKGYGSTEKLRKADGTLVLANEGPVI